MNQVPWRRILERAGDEAPGDRGASVINLRDHASDRQQARREPPLVEDSDLESELKRALDRANRKEREQSATRSPPRGAPQDGRARAAPQQRSAPMLRPDMAMHQQPLILPPSAQKKSGSGARNLLAISLSAAVIGFAFYQLGNQWSEINSGQQADVSPPALEQFGTIPAPALSAKSTDRIGSGERSRAEFEGNRLDLRPSFATEANPQPTRANREQLAALSEDIEQAAKLMARQEASQPVRASGQSAEGTEQTMLRRGHDMVQQGRVESARLVFEHLAEQKSALGAFALAQTYDARFLQERGIRDVSPDPALAAQWYQKAAELTVAR
jgi:hypothetical protein